LYFILLITVIFLKGPKEGIVVFILSLISIILITSIWHHHSSIDIALGIIPFFVALMFMYFFEQRNNNLKNLLEAQKKEYLHQAQYDDLTEIANRGLFMDRLSHALAIAKRSNKQVAVVFIDLDHFKSINDSLGHHTGDLVLQEVAKRLKLQIRESDTIARLGGDEYALVLDSFSNIKVLKNILKKLLTTIDEPFIFENNKIEVTLSLGVTLYPDDADKADTLLRNADAAMYKAKANGKNGYSFYNTSL
jgi:diguanylate cyclase (GGDEF)-like protein